MRIVVQKFGGTSVASHEGRLRAAEHIEEALSEKFSVVVVVSAMGRKGDPYATDTLLKAINDSGCASKRDLDILMSCGEAISSVKIAGMLRSRGHEVVVLSGQQAGIITNGEYGRARILEVQPNRILDALKQGQIVVVMGFQGASKNGDITTLDRGGSDTTAAALGGALKASYVDIFTDVEGIMTADPKIVKDAVCVPKVTYQEACNLANHGAKVIHPRAVEMAMQMNVPIRVRSTFLSSTGTLIVKPANQLDDKTLHNDCVTGITQKPEMTQFLLERKIVERYKVADVLLEREIYASVYSGHADRVTLTVANQDAEFVMHFLNRRGYTPKTVSGCAQVAVVLSDVIENLSIKTRMIHALAHANIDVILSSNHTQGVVWSLVSDLSLEKAVQVLYEEFQLNFHYESVLA